MAMVATPALRRALASNLCGLRSALVSAATTTIMPSLSLPTWFPGFLKAFLRGLVKKKVWPPSRQNFKMYVGGWAFMYSMLYIFFVRKGKSKEAEAEKKRKRARHPQMPSSLTAREMALHADHADGNCARSVGVCRGLAEEPGQVRGRAEG